MDIPEYISKSEVQTVCLQLGISDWTELDEAAISLEDARKIQAVLGAEALMVTPQAFKQGLEVELEHGITFPDANVTNNHPLLTGMIVLAHLKEMLDYYERLEVAELEGDIVKALKGGDTEKVNRKTRQLIRARAALHAIELAALGAG